MDIALTDSESKYYNDLFNLCDAEKIGKVPKLKAEEFFRTAKNIENDILTEINQLAGVIPSFLYLNRNQFFSCLRLIGAYQSKIMPLRKEILTSSTLQIPLPKFSWKLELEPPAEVVDPTMSQQNGLAASSSQSSHSPDLIELSAKESHQTVNSDLPSTDSEMEQTDNEREASARKRLGINSLSASKQSGKTKRTAGGGSPTWSTASESPTPTNSTHNSVELSRPWASNSQSWQGLLCEEQRQLLGTEEESSDKHSSDEEDDLDLEALYQITSEQKEYYLKQFRTVQPDIGGLLSGIVAKVFFEKSRIPVEELRHIWQLCDVTRDGALDVAEFTAAMHLVVLRRNNIPIPSILPSCLQPKVLYKTLDLPHKESTLSNPSEVDLLNLESDNDNQESSHRITQRTNAVNKNEYQRMISSTYDDYRTSGGKSTTIMNKSSTLPKNHFSSQHRGEADGSSSNVAAAGSNTTTTTSSSNASVNNNNTNNLNLNLHSNNNKQMSKNVIINRSGSNSPMHQVDGAANVNDGTNASKEWTKFTESPTSNVSSPGPKPVNVTQAIVSDQHVIHPVPLRMTPVSAAEVAADEEALRTFRKADSLVYESGVVKNAGLDRDDASPKNQQFGKNKSNYGHHQRDSLPNDLRAIQRPHPKKPASKNIGQIPMPPLESNQVTVSSSSGTSIVKEIPPLPPPRPHRHTRSSSLDLQRIKLSNNNASQDRDMSHKKPPELPPPRISDKSFKMPSVDTYVESSTKRNEESFADFTQFPNSGSKPVKSGEYVTTIRLENPPVPQPRLQQTTSLIGPSNNNGSQRTSAFEVYRKPSSRSRNSQSPPSANNSHEVKIQEYEKQVHVISENLKQIKFPRNTNEQNSQELLKYLKEQNSLLVRLCNDLGNELMDVQKRKEEMRGKLDNHQK